MQTVCTLIGIVVLACFAGAGLGIAYWCFVSADEMKKNNAFKESLISQLKVLARHTSEDISASVAYDYIATCLAEGNELSKYGFGEALKQAGKDRMMPSF